MFKRILYNLAKRSPAEMEKIRSDLKKSPQRLEILECTNCDAEFSLVLADQQNWEYCPCCGETFL